MADQIDFTPRPVRLTQPGFQPLDQCIDVSDYDELDLQLGIVALEGTNPNVTVEVWTLMQKESEDGWNLAVAFSNLSASNSWEKKNIAGLLRYARWKVGNSDAPAIPPSVEAARLYPESTFSVRIEAVSMQVPKLWYTKGACEDLSSSAPGMLELGGARAEGGGDLDVNGAGDVLVGEPWYPLDAWGVVDCDDGRACLAWGPLSGSFDRTAPGVAHVSEAKAAGDNVGKSVDAAGDLDGDRGARPGDPRLEAERRGGREHLHLPRLAVPLSAPTSIFRALVR